MIFNNVLSQLAQEETLSETFQRDDPFGTMTCEQFYGALMRIVTDGVSSLKVCIGLGCYFRGTNQANHITVCQYYNFFFSLRTTSFVIFARVGDWYESKSNNGIKVQGKLNRA